MRLLFVVAILLAAAPRAVSQWQRLEEIPAVDVPDLIRSGDTLHALTSEAVYRLLPGAAEWQRMAELPGAITGWSSRLHYDRGGYFIGTSGGGVYRYHPEEGGWKSFNEGLPSGDARLVKAFLQRGDTLFAGTESGVFLRPLTGESPLWQNYNANLPDLIAYTVNTLALTADGSVLLSSGASGYLFRRPPGAAEWQSIDASTPFIPGLMVFSFARIGETFFSSAVLGVFRSDDDGRSWQKVPGNLPTGIDIKLIPYGDLLIAVVNRLPQNARIFYSRDLGDSWEEIAGLPEQYVYRLLPAAGNLLAATDQGLYRTPFDPLTDIEDPAPALHLTGLFPNPARDHLRLSFTLREGAGLSAQLITASGQLVMTHSAPTLPAGRHELTWLLPDLPAGIYWLQLGSGAARVVRPVVISRE